LALSKLILKIVEQMKKMSSMKPPKKETQQAKKWKNQTQKKKEYLAEQN
jgi:hypothetical protein